MTGEYRIVTLCGSVRFAEAFREAQKRLTLEECIVLSPVFFEGSGEMPDKQTRAMLADMHRRKIDLSDEIFVVNPGGYIGETTLLEIEHARRAGKKVRFLEE